MTGKIDFDITHNELLIILYSLQANADFINQHLDDEPLTDSDRNAMLDSKKYTFSAIRKIKKLINLSDVDK